MAKFTIRSGAPLHPEDTVLQHLTDMVIKGGVINPETDLLTVEPAGGGLNVDTGTGLAFIKKNANAYPVRVTTSETVPVDANSSGNPRIDSLVIYLDLAVIPDPLNSQGEDVLFYSVVAGTPDASPVAPNNSQIEAAIGASNPYLAISNIAVANGATGISNANITQVAPRVFMQTPRPVYTATYVSTLALDFTNGNQQEIALTGNIIMSEPSNMRIGDVLMVDFIQDVTGSRTVTWTFTGKTVKQVGGIVELSGVASTTDTIGIRKTSADTYIIYTVGLEIA
jgi:hypothetical protein